MNVDESALRDYVNALRRLGHVDTTIKGHLSHIRAALNWGKRNKMIDCAPTFPQIKRAKNAGSETPMKGRPITLEEFERMLAVIGKVVCLPNDGGKGKPKGRKEDPSKNEPNVSARKPDVERVPSWRFLLAGIWLSGLRRGEAMELHWSDVAKFRVDLSGKRPVFRIPAESEKGNKTGILPMTPDFAEFLQVTPKSQRRGFVFNPLSLLAVHGKSDNEPQRMQPTAVGKLIGRIGKAANVIVDWKTPKGSKKTPVFASAHDLRRSFGER